jgi:hypothetical protein
MADRISWADFPRLRDYDVFDVVESNGTPGQLNISLSTVSTVTWWKSVKLVDRTTNRIVHEAQLQDANHGPTPFTVNDTEAATSKLVIAKAKIFGVHTDMYEIYEVGEKMGRNITLTWLTDGPDNVWSAIGSFISDVVTGATRVVQTVMEVVVAAVGTVLTAIVNALAWVVGLIAAIPIVGRFIALIVHWVQFVIGWIVNAIGEIAFGIAGVVGIRQPEKILRVQVVIQRALPSSTGDPRGDLVATLSQARNQIDFLVRLLQQRANIKVLPGGPFKFTHAFTSSPFNADEFITILDRPSNPSTLDVRCGFDAWTDDLGYAGANFQIMMNNLYWGNAERIAGYAGPLVVFAVRSFSSTSVGCCGSVGCSMGPGVDYVTVQFSSQYSTLAHEVGHACGLLHVDDPQNLMNPIVPSPTLAGDFRAWLTNEQVFLLRASPHTAFA